MGCLNTRALCILLSKLRSGLPLSHGVECLIFLTFLQQQFTWFNFCMGTTGSRRAGTTIFARKAYMNGCQLCRLDARKPGEALFPRWTGHGLRFPIDLEVLLALPTCILSHRTKEAYAIVGLTSHQS